MYGWCRYLRHYLAVFYKIGDAYRRLPWRSPVYFVNAQMVPVMDKYLKENKYDAILMPHLFPAEMVTQMKAKGINLPPTDFCRD